MPKTNQELFPLQGTVLRIFPPEYGSSNGRKWVRNKFILKTLDGRDLYITKFGEFSRESVGKDVKFNASQYNETNYTVQGEIEDAGDLVEEQVAATPVAAAPAAEAAPVKRRGRPSKKTTEAVAAPTQAVATEEVSAKSTTDAISLEDQAKEIVVNNLKRAESLLIGLHRNDYTTTDIIAVGDMLGRTYVSLKIESNKDRRVESFRR